MIFKKWRENKDAQAKHYNKIEWLLESINNKLDDILKELIYNEAI